MAEAATFEALIKAVNEASAPLRAIAADVKKMGLAADAAGHSLAKMEHQGVFAALGGHIRLLRTHFGELGNEVRETGARVRESLGEMGRRVAEILPMLGAVGAVGSIGGFVEMAEHAAEAASLLEASARKTGMSAEQFAAFRTAAEMTDVSADSMERSLFRLNRGMDDVASGKNKQLAALFRQLHVNLRGANGQALSAADLMPQLADAIAHTTDKAKQSAMAMALFGRTGQDLLPLLTQGSDALREFAKLSAQVNFVPKGDQKEQLEKFKISWLSLGLAVKGFTEELGAALAPVLTPIVDSMRQWIVANRDWLATKITDEVHNLADYIASIDWNQVILYVREFAHDMRAAGEAVGGLRRIIELLLGVKLIQWTYGAVVGIIALIAKVKEAKEAFVALRAASMAAGSAEAFGPMITALATVGRLLTPITAFLAVMHPTSTAGPEHDEAPRSGPRAPPVIQPPSKDLSQFIYEHDETPDNIFNLWGLLKPTAAARAAANAAANAATKTAPVQPRLLTLPPIGMPAPPGMAPLLNLDALGRMAVPGGGAGAPAAPPLAPLLVSPGSVPSAGPLLAPSASTAGLAPPPRETHVKVQIDVNNLPPGSRVQTSSAGLPATTETNVGYANPDGHGL